MTNSKMLQSLRTLLDETPAGFWDDDIDCYPVLSIAQLEIIKLLAPKHSQALRDIVTTVSQTGIIATASNGVALPPTFYAIWSLKAHPTGSAQKSCIRREGDEYYYQDNPYLTSENDSLYYKIYNTKIYFDIDFAAGGITLDYIQKPPDISSTVNPTLNSITHNAIIYYAWGYLLNKSKLDSSGAFSLFYKALESL